MREIAGKLFEFELNTVERKNCWQYQKILLFVESESVIWAASLSIPTGINHLYTINKDVILYICEAPGEYKHFQGELKRNFLYICIN